MTSNRANTFLLSKSRCKGCGVCVAACTTGSIRIDLNTYGEYQPSFDINLCGGCGNCRNVCPMYENFGTSVTKKLFGDFEKGYVGHSVNSRRRFDCSSGGVVTEILTYLLKERKVDGVICAGFEEGSATYFNSKVCRSLEEIFASRGSKYYPIEFSKILKEVRKSKIEYAMVCLPCVSTAVRRLQAIDHRFRRIKYIISLTCGHNKTTRYLDFILAHYHMKGPFKFISFRNKGNFPFSNFTLRAVDCEGKIREEHFLNGFINRLWSEYYFAQSACLQCTDIFGVESDISCMDSWQYPFNWSTHGYNFFLVKDARLKELIIDNPHIRYKEIPLSHIANSQKVIISRKSKGTIPKEFVSNVRISDQFATENDASLIYNSLVSQSRERENKNDCVSQQKSTIRIFLKLFKNYFVKILERIKRRTGYYENLVGR